MRMIRTVTNVVLAGTAAAMPLSVQAQESSTVLPPSGSAEFVSPITANAENVRNLNIMLMVNSLLCRQSEHDFTTEYDLFAVAHQHNLAEARNAMTRDLSAIYGGAASEDAYDRSGVAMANRFGEGHPEFGCGELKQVTLRLAMNQDRQSLSEMADQLLASTGPKGASAPVAEIEPRIEADKAWVYEPRSRQLSAPRPAQEPSAVTSDEEPERLPIWFRG